MSKPVVLDLFCGAGGATIGYQRAGFDVVGMDIRPQPGYPGAFVQGDVIEYLSDTAPIDLQRFAFVHASPPCQGYSPHVSSSSSEWAGTRGKDEPRLVGRVRTLLAHAAVAYVIENVVGARDELRANLLLCGTMFGLPIPRHRLFEATFPVGNPWHRPCSGVARRYAIERGWDPRDMTVTGKGRNAGTKERWAEVMGWPGDVKVTQHGLREAIPPDYAEHIGRAFLESRAIA